MFLRKYLLLTLALLLSANLYAKDGIYITLDSGWVDQVGLPTASDVGADQTEANHISVGRIGIGYNHDLFTCLGIGLDVGYGYYGRNTYLYPFNNKSLVRSRAIEFLLLSQFHWMNWDIIGKGGGLRQTILVSGKDAQDNQTQICPELSLGLAYNLTTNFAVIVTYARVYGQDIQNFHDLNNKTPSLTEMLIGIRYSF